MSLSIERGKGGRPRAFIIEAYNIDTGGATAYGTPTHVWAKGERRPSIWADDFRDAAIAKLDEWGYQPEVDYIVISGAIVPLMLVVSELVATFGEIKALLFSATENRYVERVLGFVENGTEQETAQC